MSVLAILYFFVVIWGLGYGLSKWVKQADDLIERNVMRLGIGLGTFVVLALLFNVLHIPLRWWLFLFFALAVPLFDLAKHLKEKKGFSLPALPKLSVYAVLLFIIFGVTLFVYMKGSFVYPWLEDSDPWDHAKTASYIADRGTAYEPSDIERDLFQYTDAYPPGYPILNGMLIQVSKDTFWILKFFNALLLSLGILFFHYFVYRLTASRKKALIATIILAVVPAYMSHFIWSLTLSVLLYYVAFYAAEMIKEDKRWWIIAGIMTAAILMTQATTAFKFGIFFGVYWMIRAIIDKKWHFPVLGVIVLGGLLAVALWWGPSLLHWGYPEIVTKGLYQETTSNVLDPAKFVFYSWNDFFAARGQNMINNPVGFGPVAFLLYLLSLLFIIFSIKSYLKKPWVLFAVAASILAFLMIHGSKLPFRMDPHRSWMLLAIFLSIVVAEGITQVSLLLKNFKVPAVLTITVLVGLVVMTSFPAKYEVNTAMWGHDGGPSLQEIEGYNWMRTNIPLQTAIFHYSDYERVMAYSMYSCEWCASVANFRIGLHEQAASSLHSFLQKEEYQYLVFTADAMRRYRSQYGENTTAFFNGKLQEIAQSGLFQSVYQNENMVIFKV